MPEFGLRSACGAAFHRDLGLEFQDDAESQPHTEVELPGGLRIAFDTAETIRSFHPEWSPAQSDGRIELAFACDSHADVDATYAALRATRA